MSPIDPSLERLVTADSNSDAVRALQLARRIHTQRELAALLQYHPKQISRWELGKSPIPFAVVPALRAISAKHRDSEGGADFTFVDLFAGIGGIRLGFERVGGRCLFTSEWDSYAQKTYRENFGSEHAIAGDITKIEAGNLPDHDVLLAGFPCQPFSIAGVSKKNALGHPHGFECTTQGTLFFDVARIIAEKKPASFLLENVKNLLSHDKGNTFAIMKDTLERQLGYRVHVRVIDGRHFVPQHRERILIVGFRDTTSFDWDALPLPKLGTDSPTLRRVLHREDGTEFDQDGGRYIDTQGNVQKKYTLTDRLWTYLQAYAKKHRAKGNGFGCSVVGPDETSRTLSARYFKDGSEILIDRGLRKNPRRLTPRECARLMGFPDDYRIVVSDTRAYKQFGNSVVVPVIEHVAKLMKPAIMELKASREGAGVQQSLFRA